MENIADIDEGRDRWHEFLRQYGSEHKAPLAKMEEIFQGIWKDTRDERKR